MMPQSVPKRPSATFSWSDPRKNGKSLTLSRRPWRALKSEIAIAANPRSGMNVVTAE